MVTPNIYANFYSDTGASHTNIYPNKNQFTNQYTYIYSYGYMDKHTNSYSYGYIDPHPYLYFHTYPTDIDFHAYSSYIYLYSKSNRNCNKSCM